MNARRLAIVGLVLVLGVGACARRSPAPAAQATPDFSGVWLPDSQRSGRLPKDWPLTPAAQAAVDAYSAKYLPIDPTVDDPNVSCVPEPFPYNMRLIAQYPFEIVSTPGQLTMLFEVFGAIRRIYLDGRRPSPEQLPSTMGYSVGHWEGQTLVVETTRVKTDGTGPFSGLPPRSSARRFTERLSLGRDENGRKQLRDEISIEDPPVLASPVTLHMAYKWSPDIAVGEYLCQQDIWDSNVQGNPSSVPWRH